MDSEIMKPVILHGFSGSVASILMNKINDNYVFKLNCLPRYVFTNSSLNFTNENDRPCFSHTDEDEWERYRLFQKVLHIELTQNASKFIIAPCSANTLAKIANGICDNLLTCCARAWDFNKSFVIAPSMNTHMWNHPITQKHIDTVKSWGIIVKNPVVKTLFCGDTGMGAMADINEILS